MILVTIIFTLADMSVRSGMVMVWTRFPFTIRRISILSGVKAITYGKAQTKIYKNIIFKYLSY